MTRLRAFATSFTILCLAGSLASCREEGDIRIASLKFEGVEQVDEGALASALKTRKEIGRAHV